MTMQPNLPIRTNWPLVAALVLLASGISGCSESRDEPANRRDVSGRPPNVLLVIADDVGRDLLPVYGLSPDAPPTPTIDQLAQDGVRFANAYSFPWCSPTRAGILTGMYPPRHFGIGRAIRVERDSEVSLPTDAMTLPRALDRSTQWEWSHALVGKWHLTKMADGAVDAPLRHGFQRFRGSIANLYANHAYDGNEQNYYDWERVDGGGVERTSTYATTQTVDDALAVIGEMKPPWFLWLAFQTAHDPYDAPPDDLHGYGDLSGAPVAVRYRAMVEALDRELGRLLSSMEPETRRNTLVIFIGDNGSDPEALTGGLEGLHAKPTLFELGVHVPLIVSGEHVAQPGRVFDGLVHTNDIFASVLEIGDVLATQSPSELDSISFVPALLDPLVSSAREVVYSETYAPNGPGPYQHRARMLRDERFKLIEHANGSASFFDLRGQSVEGPPLDVDQLEPNARAAYDSLRRRLNRGDF
jgi:arylsulfatase B